MEISDIWIIKISDSWFTSHPSTSETKRAAIRINFIIHTLHIRLTQHFYSYLSLLVANKIHNTLTLCT